MAARSESGFDLTRPSPEAFENLATDLTPEESDVLLRHGTALGGVYGHIGKSKGKTIFRVRP